MSRVAVATVGLLPAAWGLRHVTSPAVRQWEPPTLPGRRVGRLYARAGGDGERAVVLLHGLVSTGDVFGAPYDELAATHRLVVPDLLGFGRSLDESATAFPIVDHLDALDHLATATGIFDRPVTIGAHSMGSSLALHWAARHPGVIDRVVCWGAPIQRSPERAEANLAGSAMARVFALDTRWAERVCAVNCRHRTAAGWFAAAWAPTLPTALTRAAPLHTWPAYRDAIRQLVIDVEWGDALRALSDRAVRVELVWGRNDHVGDHRYGEELAGRHRDVEVAIIDREGHHLPIARPALCADRLAD
ncbi:MAG: alpha/beta hydrolase [Ilumatobacter sp.]|nr:alpha/beta hydrolase [Ilumatobacter sp.]